VHVLDGELGETLPGVPGVDRLHHRGVDLGRDLGVAVAQLDAVAAPDQAEGREPDPVAPDAVEVALMVVVVAAGRIVAEADVDPHLRGGEPVGVTGAHDLQHRRVQREGGEREHLIGVE
jgi:hypothetical protein